MSRRFRSVLVLLALGLAPLARGQDLVPQIETLLAKHRLGDAQVSVYAADLATGLEIAALNPDVGSVPASTMKLITSGTALAIFGPDFAFETRVERAGDVIIIRAGGDPGFGDPDLLERADPPMTPESLMEALAQAIAQRDPSPVREIVVDDRIFDRELLHPSWEPEDLLRPYAAPVSGLNYQFNTARLFVTPARNPGVAPVVTLEPSARWLTVENSAETRASGSNTVWATRLGDENRFKVFGNVVVRPPVPMRVTMHDPALLAGQLFADHLMRAGVPVGGQGSPGFDPSPAVRLADADERLPSGTTVAIVRTPMAEILERCNTDSANLYAEALAKRIAHEVTGEPGSWHGAAAVIRMTLTERLGPGFAASTVVADGSGLSRDDRVTSRTLVAWLRSFAGDQELRGAWFDSLATPGVGTFTSRFRGVPIDHRVMGKSGTLTGVRTLAGYVVDPVTGEGVAFAVLVNSIPGKKTVGVNGRDFADEVTNVFDDYLADQLGEHAKGG